MSKHIFSIGVAVTLVFSFAASASTTTVTLQFGQKSVAVATLQNLLVKNGYLATTYVTGYFGPLTQNALKAFQKANNFPQTGTFTLSADRLPAFFAAASSSAAMVPGTTGIHVQSLQTFLIKKGYLKLSTPTTYFGPLTQAAVISFQKAHGLPQTGAVDAATFAVMNGK